MAVATGTSVGSLCSVLVQVQLHTGNKGVELQRSHLLQRCNGLQLCMQAMITHQQSLRTEVSSQSADCVLTLQPQEGLQPHDQAVSTRGLQCNFSLLWGTYAPQCSNSAQPACSSLSFHAATPCPIVCCLLPKPQLFSPRIPCDPFSTFRLMHPGTSGVKTAHLGHTPRGQDADEGVVVAVLGPHRCIQAVCQRLRTQQPQ